jgi:F-box/leucine-rich repeat protein 2/20
VKSLKRLPQTILTEENLRTYLSKETAKLGLEHAYWLKDVFLDKIGRMAPNLQERSLRRLKIRNRAFSEIMGHMKRLEVVDVAECVNIQESGLELMITNNQHTLREL